ncbi:Hypp5574 [Branchiostoma lanceolatum]|nr:Hypp5574 [Branchiostoma lanceolatum]
MASKGRQVVEEVIQKTDVNASKGKRQQVTEDTIVPEQSKVVPARKADYVPGVAPPPEVIKKTLGGGEVVEDEIVPVTK